MLSDLSEIGSEFWIERLPETHLTDHDGVYCLSGRTAIDLILQDIMRKRGVKSAAMPAWCCDSMIAPFRARGIEVLFYDFNETVFTNKTDIFFLTNFFGYENTINYEIVKQIKDQGSIILYDRTHSFFLNDAKYRMLADYCFASIRKWMGVVDGAVVEGLYEKPKLKDCPYVSVKKAAMCNKYHYLKGEGGVQKKDFLASFDEFSQHLKVDYCNYVMDDLSYTLYKREDWQSLVRRRRENAAYIHRHLKNVQFVFEMTDCAVPLFVPVLFENKVQRDYIRKKLTEAQIYCPIHWPLPPRIPKDYQVNDIVSRELSLLCDQRYGLSEMEKIVTMISQIN